MQLPALTNPKELNKQILQDLENRTDLRLGGGNGGDADPLGLRK
jgi:hypothetical protein